MNWLWLFVPEFVALVAWLAYDIGYDRGLNDCEHRGITKI